MTENAYLVGLLLADKKVVVVGGGTVAQRRLPLLVATGADVHVISMSATPAVEAMGGITLTLRSFREGDLEGELVAPPHLLDESLIRAERQQPLGA